MGRKMGMGAIKNERKETVFSLRPEADLILGIDPGLSGAFAYYRPFSRELVTVEDFPLSLSHTGKRTLDAYTLGLIVDNYSKRTAFAVVEKVSARTYKDSNGQIRGQGASSSFKFGECYGIVLGVLSANLIPTLTVLPQVWKPQMALSHDKNVSRHKASELFPAHSSLFKRHKDDGRAEAALLAYFGSVKLRMTSP